jgi:hypothetical protein
MAKLDWDKANQKPSFSPSDIFVVGIKKAPIKKCQKCGTYFSSWKANARYCYQCYLQSGKKIATKKRKRLWKRQKHYTQRNRQYLSKTNIKWIATDRLW